MNCHPQARKQETRTVAVEHTGLIIPAQLRPPAGTDKPHRPNGAVDTSQDTPEYLPETLWDGPVTGVVCGAVRVKLTRVPVGDQDRAPVFYTEVLGFVKRRDEPAGEYRGVAGAPGWDRAAA